MQQSRHGDVAVVGKRVSWVLGAILLLLASPRPASAYLDPASGSMLLQLILGGVAGVAVAARLFWRRLLSRWRPKPEAPAGTEDSRPSA